MNPIVLKADNISRSFCRSKGFLRGKYTIAALKNISFELQEGKTVAVVGESGSGKSTLARILVGSDYPSSGSLTVLDSESTPENHFNLQKQIRLIFQNPYASLNPSARIGNILEEALRNHTSLNKKQRKEKIVETLTQVGLRQEHANRYPHMFSAGQRQCIAIARALILEPKIIVADEPISALDAAVQAQMLNLLMDIQESSGIAYVFISHDLGVVKQISDHVLVLYFGQMMEYGPTETIFTDAKHPYTQALLASSFHHNKDSVQTEKMLLGEIPSTSKPPVGCPFATRCSKALNKCHQLPLTTTKLQDRLISCHLLT